MKIIKRIFLLVGAIALTLTLGIGAFASEVDEGYTDDTVLTENSEGENPFDTLFSVIGEYSSEIFSALAFVATVTVGAFYKKGMLPTLRSSLGSVTKSLTALSDGTRDIIAPISERCEKISEALDGTAKTVGHISNSLGELEAELLALKDREDEQKAYRLVMLSQVDMLYDIFMSSALPQYKKDEIGERIGAMKAELGCHNENKE